MSPIVEARFQIGQIVEHKLFNYRGVIFEVDAVFSMSDEWYEQMARSRPPKDRPWYYVLVDNAVHTTYVAERNLLPSANFDQIHHPQLSDYFSAFKGGLYLPKNRLM